MTARVRTSACTRQCAAAAAIASVVLVSLPSRPGRADPYRADSPSDVDERPRVGVAEGVTKLSSALEYAGVGSDHSFRIGGDFEHMLRNRWGLVGSLSIPVSGPWLVPATMGLRIHALPGAAVDPFFSAAGGFAWVDPKNIPNDVVPMLAMRVGATLYSTGLYFVQAEGGYDFVRYSHAGIGFDLGGVVGTARAGIYF